MGLQLSARADLAVKAGGASGVLGRTIQALWFTAGTAMLVFTAFLAVLVIAALVFRLSGPNRRRNSTAVFSVSSVVVVVVVSLLLTIGSFHDRSGGGTRAVAGAPAVTAPPMHIYPALSGMPLQYANGGSSGAGVHRSKTRALVLYDATAAAEGNAELDATKLINLISHFGAWTAHPVGRYRAGEMKAYDAVFYLGASDGDTVPPVFLHDAALTRHPVMWINGGIAQFTASGRSDPAGRYGFKTEGLDAGPFTRLEYHGTSLPINQASPAGLMRIAITDPAKAVVLGQAIRADGTSLPWALRSGNLLYVTEDPLPYLAYDNDRYLAFADLLFDVLAPKTLARHRALVRLEDVGPTEDPVKLRAVVDYLASQGVPFSIGVYPVYRDPAGVSNGGRDVTIRLAERPELVQALKYAVSRGGAILMHGYTHQYSTVHNPLNGQSGDDAEFYLTQFDQAHQFLPVGPVAEDSAQWALGRLDAGIKELRAAGLPKPAMFEFPHYMASPVDYVASGQRFHYRYERTLYFPGLLSGGPVDDTGRGWQLFPYTVRDIYGAVVVPENLDYVRSTGDSVPEMLDDARANLAVRDGVASFFYHPFLGVGQLPRLVSGIRAMGYTFVSAKAMVASP